MEGGLETGASETAGDARLRRHCGGRKAGGACGRGGEGLFAASGELAAAGSSYLCALPGAFMFSTSVSQIIELKGITRCYG